MLGFEYVKDWEKKMSILWNRNLGCAFLLFFILLFLPAIQAEAAPTLKGVWVSDYVTYTHICLKLDSRSFSADVVTLTDEHIMITVANGKQGDFSREYSVDSVTIDKLVISEERKKGELVITVPFNDNVNLKGMEWHKWDYMITVDIPLIRPNHSRIPTEEYLHDFKLNGGKVVIIDPGHGGFDPGAEARITKTPRMQEKDLALDISRRLKNKFDDDPMIASYLTRDGDYLPVPFGAKGSGSKNRMKDYIRESLWYRQQLAKEYRGDIYISVHFNAPHPRTSHWAARGFEIYYLGEDKLDEVYNRDLEALKEMHNEIEEEDGLLSFVSQLKRDKIPYDSMMVAGYITQEVKNVPGMVLRDPALKPNRFIVIQQSNMPSVLVECGFITHPTEHEFFRADKNRDRFVKAVYDAVRKFINPTDHIPVLTLLEEQQKELIKPKTASSSPPSYIYYNVRRGDSLSKIAQNYNTSVATLRRLNGRVIGRGDTIRVGAKLKIPQSGKTPSIPPSAKPITYTVQRNDTLGKIAQKFDTDVTTIKQLNNKRTNTIYRNEKLKIMPGVKRGSSLASAKPSTYTVQSNDTLGKIADRFNTTVKALQNANNIRGTIIHKGDKLFIP